MPRNIRGRVTIRELHEDGYTSTPYWWRGAQKPWLDAQHPTAVGSLGEMVINLSQSRVISDALCKECKNSCGSTNIIWAKLFWLPVNISRIGDCPYVQTDDSLFPINKCAMNAHQTTQQYQGEETSEFLAKVSSVAPLKTRLQHGLEFPLFSAISMKQKRLLS